MVDFKKLRQSKTQPSIEPTEIFRRLPKPQGINDLYTSQDQVLKEWCGFAHKMKFVGHKVK